MDNDLLKILSEEVRETRRLANAAWAGVEEMRKDNAVFREELKANQKKADAAWELVVMTRNQINRPWLKKILGLN